jgi:hypothetical protein
MRGMNANDNGREARVRAAKRLRTITIGTTILGVAATGGFGALAAVTYHGTTTTATLASTTTAATTTTSGTTTTTTTTTATQAPAVTTTTGTGHVSTGSS